jgi:hypothetical protein
VNLAKPIFQGLSRAAPLLLFLGGLSAAQAKEVPCAPVASGTLQLDGLLTDWKGAEAVYVNQVSQVISGHKQWTGPSDLSFEIYCNHDETRLYLALNVNDEYFIRTPQAQGDDHVLIHFGRSRLEVYPGDLKSVPARLLWGGKKGGKGMKMAEALQQHGYSLELQLPLGLLPGFRKGMTSFAAAVWVADSDSKAQRRTQTILGTAPSAAEGRFVFSEAHRELQGFLQDKGYGPRDIRFDKQADVVGDKTAERVLLVGKTIAIMGQDLPGGAYFYLDLAVARAQDISWLKLVDLNGDKKVELLTRHLESSHNGRRELISVFRYNSSNRFVRAFVHEILKGQDDRTLSNRLTIKHHRQGNDLMFDRPLAKGFTEKTYQEQPASDCFPILLPWGSEKSRTFRFEGDSYYQP